MTTRDARLTTLTDDLVDDRVVAEQLQDRLRREQQTATALREYLLDRAATSRG